MSCFSGCYKNVINFKCHSTVWRHLNNGIILRQQFYSWAKERREYLTLLWHQKCHNVKEVMSLGIVTTLESTQCTARPIRGSTLMFHTGNQSRTISSLRSLWVTWKREFSKKYALKSFADDSSLPYKLKSKDSLLYALIAHINFIKFKRLPFFQSLFQNCRSKVAHL